MPTIREANLDILMIWSLHYNKNTWRWLTGSCPKILKSWETSSLNLGKGGAESIGRERRTGGVMKCCVYVGVWTLTGTRVTKLSHLPAFKGTDHGKGIYNHAKGTWLPKHWNEIWLDCSQRGEGFGHWALLSIYDFYVDFHQSLLCLYFTSKSTFSLIPMESRVVLS